MVYIPYDHISLRKRSQINNFGFVPGKVFRDRVRDLYKMDENKLCQKGKMEEVNNEKSANTERMDGICTKAGVSAVVPGFGEDFPRLAQL